MVIFIFLFAGASAFIPNTNRRNANLGVTTVNSMPPLLVLRSENSKDNDGEGGEMRNRRALVTESIAPFRGLRLFLYGALGSGAFVGGLINTSGAIAASNSPEFDLSTEVR